MKSLVVLALVLGSSVSFAGNACKLGSIESQILQETRGRMRNYPELTYTGSKVAIYSARIENNGGEMQIEAVVTTDDCKLLKTLLVWGD